MRPFLIAAGVLFSIALVSMWIFATGVSEADCGKAMSLGFATWLSMSAVGGFLGFLFGIPRLFHTAEAGAAAGTQFAHNTNLEQISDWLTKILVGVGLTQLDKIGPKLHALVEFLSSGLQDATYAQGYFLGLVLYGLVSGFMLVYIWTRLKLPAAFANVKLAQAWERMSAARDKKDVVALETVDAQLVGAPDARPVREMAQALEQASAKGQEEAFYRARRLLREELWKEGVGPDAGRPADSRIRVARVVPVLEALTAISPENHRYHAQLAYAFMHGTNPDWKRGAEEFTEAIRAREAQGVDGFNSYEFGRAVCRIHADDKFTGNARSDADPAKAIAADLASAAEDEWVQSTLFDKESLHGGVVDKWKELNK